MQAVGVLVGIDGEQRGFRVEMVGQGNLEDVRVDVGVAVVLVDDASSSCWLTVAGSSVWIDFTPISAESSRFRRTYAWLGGSSPTRIVPSPGVIALLAQVLDARRAGRP